MTTQDSLESLAKQIVENADKADEYVVAAAMLIREARKRVEAGDAGNGVTWSGWAEKNIELSPSRLRELDRIAKADDPASELTRLRELASKRAAKHRAKQKEKAKPASPLRNGDAETIEDSPSEPVQIHSEPEQDLEPERRELAEWSKSAPIDDVRHILALAKTRTKMSDIPPLLDRRKKAA